jgi:hypothetical protein
MNHFMKLEIDTPKRKPKPKFYERYTARLRAMTLASNFIATIFLYFSFSCYGFTTTTRHHGHNITIRLSASTKITMPKDDKHEPVTKKVKREAAADDDDDEDEETNDKSATEVKRNSKGEAYFDLGSSKKRCTISTWKKNILVDIREFYEKNDEYLPGKKGISLTLEQFEALKEVILDGSIDKQIKEMGK